VHGPVIILRRPPTVQAKARKLAEAKAAQEAAAAKAPAKEQAKQAAAATTVSAPITEPALAPYVPAAPSALIKPGTTLTAPNYKVEFLKDEYVQIIIDLKQPDYTPEHFFKTFAELLSDGDLDIATILASRTKGMSSDRQPRQEVLDKMVVDAMEEARNAIRQHIRSTFGK
jgi:hypothetical protein